VERVSLITEADYRNVVIFPEKFNGLYARLDRPHSEIAPWSIWISWSPDLRYWGESQLVMKPETYHWDEMKIGPGAPPIKTDEGWLSIYHGVFRTMDGSIYRLGVALHDLRNPARIVGVGDSWILQRASPIDLDGSIGFGHGATGKHDIVNVSRDFPGIFRRTQLCAWAKRMCRIWWPLCLDHGRPATQQTP
jgi:beta-1,2-mannobiose phosphorylase / 1,2-beta-oligomannan phosphorylase